MPLTREEKHALLEEIRNQHPEHKLQARDVVAVARSQTHPLHGYFQWDNTKAAEAFRLVQARNLIRSVVVLNPQDARPVMHPVYISLIRDRIQDGGGYRAMEDITTQDILTQEMLAAALRDLQAWASRYRMLERIVQPTVQRFEQLLGAERTPSRTAAD
jgi:hypothetical protein